MRIAYFVQLATPAQSGISRKIRRQAAEWQKLGHDVTVIVTTRRAEVAKEFVSSSCRVFRFEPSRLHPPFDGRIATLRAALQELKKWGPDVVYTRQDVHLPVLRALYHRFVTIIEVNTDDLAELRNSDPLFRAYYTWTRRFPLKNAAGVVYPSHEIAQARHYRRYANAACVISNGADLSTPSLLDFAHSHAGRVQGVFLCGDDYPWHGLDKVMQLAAARPGWSFDIVGLCAPTGETSTPANVEFHGRLPQEAYASILTSATFGIGTLALHRKHMNEASPLKVREYLSYGLPVILAYQDTDFADPPDFLLQLPNVESNVLDNLDSIDAFVQRWRERRVDRRSISHLDYAVKEEQRIHFMKSLCRGGIKNGGALDPGYRGNPCT